MRDLTDTVLRVRFTDMELERRCCEELLALTDEQGSTYAKAFAYTYLGDYYLAMNDAINSGRYLESARECCHAQTYPALYMKLCHLSGFYYHVTNDEQNALQYYMEAQVIAKQLDDTNQMCNAWNNIADMFERHEKYDQANYYYLLAYNTMLEKDCHDSRLMIMLEFNLANNNGYLGKYDEMERYLDLCENIVTTTEESTFNRIACQSGRCMLAAYRGQVADAVQIASDILDNGIYGITDRYSIMEFLMPVARAMVTLNSKECAKRCIDLLSIHCTANETLPMRHLVAVKIRYAQAFCHGDELLKSYENYYFTMQNIMKAEDSVRAQGMNAKINLMEMITQHKTTLQENERLVDAVNVDELTGIRNRRYFNLRVQEERSTESHIGVIMLDIDYFKQFNDTYGHISGDFVLREVAIALNCYATDSIVPCRYGGDEFVCLCVNITDDEIEHFIVQVMDYIKVLAIPHRCSPCSNIVTLSVGYSNMLRSFCGDSEVAIRQADSALYVAKEKGRNCWKKCVSRRAEDG